MQAELSPPDGTSGESSANFDLAAYLDRIGLSQPPARSPAGLAQLHRAHRAHVAFENFDIPLGRGISLDPDAVFDKLVRRGRGGYCFEQSGLFERALIAMGHQVRPLLARVWLRAGPGEVPPRTHQLALVAIDGRPWIADAGFGGSLAPPMMLAEGDMGPCEDGAWYRLSRDGDHGWMLERRGPGTLGDDAPDQWQPQYSFTTDHVQPVDRELSNHWTATRPATLFTSVVMATRPVDGGFISLMGCDLRIRSMSETRAMTLDSPAALRDAAGQWLNIPLTDEEAERLFAFAPPA